MALLGKKAQGAQAPTKKRGKRLRENERLRSVIKESTFGAAVETLNRNVRFRLAPDAAGNPRYLALLMNADAIGGLSEKTKRDEAKGALVQQILSDQIEAIALSEMLEREFVSFVPSQGTLELLGEYDMMVKAEYFWVVYTFANDVLTFDKDIGPASYADALAIQAGASIEQVVSSSGDEGAATWGRIAAGGVATEVSAEDDDEVFGEAAIAEVQAPAEVAADVRPYVPATAAVEVPAAEQAPAPSAVAVATEPDTEDASTFYADLASGESEYQEFDANDDDFDGGAIDDPFDGGTTDEVDTSVEAFDDADDEQAISDKTSYLEYVRENHEREFTEEEVRDTIARRFLADDLDLIVDMAEFDLAFHNENPRIDVAGTTPGDSSDWLGEQVAQVAQVANSELEALHQRHYEELSQQYIDFTSRHIQEVIRQVSLADTTSKFGRMMSMADADRDAAIADRFRATGARRKEVEDRFKEEADAAAEAAAQQARVTYTQMNRGRREAALSQIDQAVTQDIDGQYESQRQQVLQLRRVDADLGMQQGKTLIFEALVEARAEQASVEDALRRQWNARILQVIEDNRKADIVRAEALTEALARENTIEAARLENEARLSEIRADHAARIQELEQRALQANKDAVAHLERSEAAWARQLEQVTDESQRSSQLVSELYKQMEGASVAIHKQYEARIETLETSRDEYARDVERTSASARRTQRSALMLMALMTVAALAVGVVVGWTVFQTSSQVETVQQSAIVTEHTGLDPAQ